VSSGSNITSRCNSIVALNVKLGRDLAGGLAEGLPREEILERALRAGVVLPDQVVDLYAWRNGCQRGHAPETLWLLPGYRLLTLDEALGRWAALPGLVPEGCLPLLSNEGPGTYVVQCGGPGWGRILHGYPGSSDHGLPAFPDLDALLAAIEEALASRAFVLRKGKLAPDHARWLPIAAKYSGGLPFWLRRLESLDGTVYAPTPGSTPTLEVAIPRLVREGEWVRLGAWRRHGTWRRMMQRQVRPGQFATPFEPRAPEEMLQADLRWIVDPDGAAELGLPSPDGHPYARRIRFRKPGKYQVRACSELAPDAQSPAALVTVLAPNAQAELVDAVADATRAAVTTLFREHPDDDFYYLSLITTGDVHAPTLTAWSWDALEATVRARPDDPQAREMFKWSWADSPFVGYGDQHFDHVQRLYRALGSPDDGAPDEASSAFDDFRMEALVAAMQRLDGEGLFGRGSKRDGILINVEWMPPEPANVARARRLNPPNALVAWLNEAAELE